jgi:hypothetical protein
LARVFRNDRSFTLVIALTSVLSVVVAWGQDVRADLLDQLVTPAEREFLLHELARIQPPERIRNLAGYSQRQSDLGGGFYGMMPDQLADPDSIPVPTDAGGRLEAALCMARQRQENLVALMQLNPDYAQSFRDDSLAEFLCRVHSEKTADGGGYASATLYLELDVSALQGFFEVLADGEVTSAEAASLAALPSNQAMLQHRRDLGYIPEPLPNSESLARMIEMAGSTDPLDRLWCWINSQNAFDYADLVQNAKGYHRLLAELEDNGDALVDAVLAQIARYIPPDIQFETTFAMTVGWAIRGWATPEMAGLNIEQVKDDWPFLFGTMIEETYHRLQLELFPHATATPAREYSDLVVIDTGDARYDRLFEIVTYTVAEGAANLARGPYVVTDLEEKATVGAELMARFVSQVINEGDLDSADALINEGLKENGPLYGLGWKLAGLIAQRDGGQAVGKYQQQGSVSFFLYGASLAAATEEPLLTPEVTAAIDNLRVRLVNGSR